MPPLPDEEWKWVTITYSGQDRVGVETHVEGMRVSEPWAVPGWGCENTQKTHEWRRHGPQPSDLLLIRVRDVTPSTGPAPLLHPSSMHGSSHTATAEGLPEGSSGFPSLQFFPLSYLTVHHTCLSLKHMPSDPPTDSVPFLQRFYLSIQL